MPNLTYSVGDFVPFTVIKSADVNAKFNDIQTLLNITRLDDDNIQDNGITASAKLIDGSISTTKLADESVTTDKIADGAVTGDKFAGSSIDTPSLADNAVTFDKIGANFRGYIDGFITAPAEAPADPDDDIQINPGVCISDDGTDYIELTSALVKQTDVSWVAGDSAGGWDTGSKNIDSTIHIFVIKNPTSDTVDVLFSASATTPTLPTGYTLKRRIASILTDSLGDIVPYEQIGNRFYKEAESDHTSTPSSLTNIVVSVPAGIVVRPMISIRGRSASDGNASIRMANGGSTFEKMVAYWRDEDPSGLNRSGAYVESIYTNTSAQVAVNTSGVSSNNFDLATSGWIDDRGKNT